MAISCHTSHMLCFSPGKSASGFQQILFDHGILLVLHHGLPSLCLYLHHCKIYTDRKQRQRIQNLGSLSESTLLYPHRFACVNILAVVCYFIFILRSVALVHICKSISILEFSVSPTHAKAIL